MRIIIAPDSFKESLSAARAAQVMAEGLLQVFPHADLECLPMADGGEGTTDAILYATNGRRIHVQATDPLGEKHDAFFGLTGDGKTAIIEMAAASGLELVPRKRRDPTRTTSFGTGEVILAALNQGARHLILGLGGSATNDAGCGMLTALGVRLLTRDGTPIEPTGGGLAALDSIDTSALDPRVNDCIWDVACDVDNPLTGPEGASAVFGPQKGANKESIALLDANLKHFADLVRKELGMEMDALPGAGAAGGMGGALACFCHATLRPGIDIVAEAVGLEQKLSGCDLVVTGEGRIDGQTVHGKTPEGVARIAKRLGVPVLAIAGSLLDDANLVLTEGSIDAIASSVQMPCSLEEALKKGEENLRRATTRAAYLMKLGQRLPPLEKL